MNRDDYMDGKVDHQTFYLAVADAIGRAAIERLALTIASPETFAERGESDPHLNNIPLAKWDSLYYRVLAAIWSRGREVMAVSWSDKSRHNLTPGMVCWSRSESVCVLKATAKRLGQEWMGQQRTNQ